MRQALKVAADSPLAAIYLRHSPPTRAGGLADSDLDVEAVMSFLAGDSGRSCIHANGLTRRENLALLTTNLEEEMVSLILRGLKQSWDSQARSFHGRVPAP